MRLHWRFVVIGLIAVTLVACGGEEETKKPAGTSGGATTEGGGVEGATDPDPVTEPEPAATAETAEDAFRRIQKAVTTKDFASYYGMLSAGTRAKVDDLAKTAITAAESALGRGGVLLDAAKAAFKEEYGFGPDAIQDLKAEDVGEMIIAKMFEKDMPGIYTGEVQGSTGDDTAATVSVKKPNGKLKDVEMVREDGAWKLKTELE